MHTRVRREFSCAKIDERKARKRELGNSMQKDEHQKRKNGNAQEPYAR